MCQLRQRVREHKLMKTVQGSTSKKYFAVSAIEIWEEEIVALWSHHCCLGLWLQVCSREDTFPTLTEMHVVLLDLSNEETFMTDALCVYFLYTFVIIHFLQHGMQNAWFSSLTFQVWGPCKWYPSYEGGPVLMPVLLGKTSHPPLWTSPEGQRRQRRERMWHTEKRKMRQ